MITSIKYWMKNPVACLFIFGYMILNIISSLERVWIIRAINDIISNPDNFMSQMLLIVIALVSSGLFQSFSHILKTMGRAKCFTNLMDKYIEKIINMDYPTFVKYSCGYILTTAEQINGTTSISLWIASIITQFISAMIVLYSMYTIIPLSILPYFILYIIAIAVFLKLFKVYDNIHKKAAAVKRKRNQEVDEIVNGFSEIRSYNTQKKHLQIARELNNETLKIINKQSMVNLLINVVFDTVYCTGVIMAILFVISRIDKGELTIGTGIAFVTYSMTIINGVINMVSSIDEVATNCSQIQNFDEIMNLESSKDGDIKLNDFNSSIKFDDISFQYDNSNLVLKDINLTIKRGERIGICGVSGGGKSTLMKLFLRFYKPSSGRILIDGIDIQDLDIGSVRDKIGIVSQDTYIFDKSIKENIMYSKEVNDVDLVDAAKKAGIYDFIKSLPDGFDTNVGPKGLKLSGGQRQRISLARVFIKDPEIVLLDEATSALDNESESIVQESLSKLKGKTVITIAHRLTTIQDSDRIVVISGNHTISGTGTHKELAETCDEYKKLLK